METLTVHYTSLGHSEQSPWNRVTNDISPISESENVISWGSIPLVGLPVVDGHIGNDIVMLAGIIETLHDISSQLKNISNEENADDQCEKRQSVLRYNFYRLITEAGDIISKDRQYFLYWTANIQSIKAGFMIRNLPDEILAESEIEEEVFYGFDTPQASEAFYADDLVEMYYLTTKCRGVKEISLLAREFRAKKCQEYFRRQLANCRAEIKRYKREGGYVPISLDRQESYLLGAMANAIQELNMLNLASGNIPCLLFN